jgi:CubicO group peptidase (beta-lactamase class C family)
MDGVSAHAGLFGTAADVGAYARAWLTLDAPFASRRWLEEANHDRSRGSGPPRGILWRLHSDNWPIGKAMSAAAYGHTGFTGTSLIVEPEQRWTCVLLTNRVHPRRANAEGVMALRREVHALVARTFGGGGTLD